MDKWSILFQKYVWFIRIRLCFFAFCQHFGEKKYSKSVWDISMNNAWRWWLFRGRSSQHKKQHTFVLCWGPVVPYFWNGRITSKLRYEKENIFWNGSMVCLAFLKYFDDTKEVQRSIKNETCQSSINHLKSIAIGPRTLISHFGIINTPYPQKNKKKQTKQQIKQNTKIPNHSLTHWPYFWPARHRLWNFSIN